MFAFFGHAGEINTYYFLKEKTLKFYSVPNSSTFPLNIEQKLNVVSLHRTVSLH